MAEINPLSFIGNSNDESLTKRLVNASKGVDDLLNTGLNRTLANKQSANDTRANNIRAIQTNAATNATSQYNKLLDKNLAGLNKEGINKYQGDARETDRLQKNTELMKSLSDLNLGVKPIPGETPRDYLNRVKRSGLFNRLTQGQMTARAGSGITDRIVETTQIRKPPGSKHIGPTIPHVRTIEQKTPPPPNADPFNVGLPATAAAPQQAAPAKSSKPDDNPVGHRKYGKSPQGEGWHIKGNDGKYHLQP